MGKSLKGWTVSRLRQFIRDTTRNYLYLAEQAVAPNIRDGAEETVLYAKDSSGTTKLFYKDSAGTEIGVGGSDLKNHIFALYASISSAPSGGYYIPWVYYTETQTVTAGSLGTMRNSMIAPFDGKFISVSVLSNGGGSAPGSTVIGVHKNNSGTAMETQTVTMAAFNTTYTGTFSSNTFSKGDVLHLNLDATNSLDYVTVTVVIEFDEST
mgnify:CR=1 FL=1|jgi:hypothetical protein